MSTPSLPLALISQRVLTPSGERAGAILMNQGRIVDVVAATEVPGSYHVDDVGSLVVMPGLVDSHVHINEPGRTEWEGFETATRAAAAGGITTLIDMPLNSSPVTTTPDAFETKCSAAEGKLHVDCGLYAGLIPGNADQIESLIEAGVLGVKAFLVHSGIDEFPNATERDLREAMPVMARHNIPLLVHCELAGAGRSSPITDTRSYSQYLASRPRQWEHDAIKLMIKLCREYTCKVHIVHVSSADAIPMIRAARAEGLPLTAETCPHYLFFSSEQIHDGDTRFKCAPPIREAENRDRLWHGLNDGTLDCIVSDHSPCPPEMKCIESGDFHNAWGGIASLQFGLPIIWTEARARGFSIADVSRWMCRRPAEIFGLQERKGKIAPGYDADLVVWNPDGKFVVNPSMILHKHRLTPYEGCKLDGRVHETFVRGRSVYSRNQVVESHNGKILCRT